MSCRAVPRYLLPLLVSMLIACSHTGHRRVPPSSALGAAMTPEATTVAASPGARTAGQPAPDFVLGTVTGRVDDTILVLVATSETTVRVSLSPDAGISPNLSWDDIQTGDRITASGEVGPDGILSARIIDVNVAQVWGTLAEVTSDGAWIIVPDARHTDLSIPRDNDGHVRVQFDPDAPPVNSQDQPIPLAKLLDVQAGRVVMVIGVRKPSASSVTAKRLLNSLDGDAPEPQ